MSTSYVRMTDGEWQQVLPLLTRIKPERLEAARRHMVDGLTLADAGEPFELSRQNVHDIVQRVLDRRLRLDQSDAAAGEGVPAGWLRITLDVPREAAAPVRRFANALARGWPIEKALAEYAPKQRRPRR